MPPHNDSVSTRSRCSCSASCCPPSTKRGPPKTFSRFFFLVFRLSGVFLLLSGLVGFPLPRFSPPLFFLWRFSSSGWVGSPCRVFPVFSPLFLGWAGGGVFFSAVRLHLASPPAPRSTWSTDPQPLRPLQLLALARPASPVSRWESSVVRAEAKSYRVTGGVVTPHTV